MKLIVKKAVKYLTSLKELSGISFAKAATYVNKHIDEISTNFVNLKSFRWEQVVLNLLFACFDY